MSRSGFSPGHQFGAREARDHLREVLDSAEAGDAVVVRRRAPVVVLRRDALDDALAQQYPLEPKVAFSGHGAAMWLEALPVHAEGADYDAAEDAFLDALVDYAEDWASELRHAPNHAGHRGYVHRIMMFAGDREELRRAVFGD